MREQDGERLRTLRSDRRHTHGNRHGLHGRVAAVLVFAAIAVLIAKQEIPWVDNWIDRTFDEPAWQAAEHCRDMARRQTGQPDFSRLLKSGKTRRTGGGYHVSSIVIAVLDPQGGEHTYHFSCNVTAAGEVVAIHGESVQVDRLKADNKPVWADSYRDP